MRKWTADTINFDPVKLVAYALTLYFLIVGETHHAVWALFVAASFSMTFSIRIR